MEITLVENHINIKKCVLRGVSMLGEFEGIVAIETLKEIGEGGQRRKMSSIKCSQRLGFSTAE